MADDAIQSWLACWLPLPTLLLAWLAWPGPPSCWLLSTQSHTTVPPLPAPHPPPQTGQACLLAAAPPLPRTRSELPTAGSLPQAAGPRAGVSVLQINFTSSPCRETMQQVATHETSHCPLAPGIPLPYHCLLRVQRLAGAVLLVVWGGPSPLPLGELLASHAHAGH